MRNFKVRALLAVIACAFGLAGCADKSAASRAENAPAPMPPETEIKERLLREYPAVANNPLQVKRLLRNGAGGEFIHPASLMSTDRGEVFVSDNNGHGIFYCPPGASAAARFPDQQGAGRLRFPTTIYLRGGQIFIADNDGIKVYGREGSFQRLIRTYYSIFNFAVSEDNRIYANVYLKEPKESDSLIVEMDGEGRKVRGLGRRLNQPGYGGADDQVYVATSGNLLVAAFKHRPVLQTFDRRQGTLVNEVKIEHRIFDALARETAAAEAGKRSLPRYVAGVSVAGESIFILLHLPHVEVVEFSLQGKERARYHCHDLPMIGNYFGFDAHSRGDGYLFTIGVLDLKWLPSLVEVEGAKPTNQVTKEEKL